MTGSSRWRVAGRRAGLWGLVFGGGMGIIAWLEDSQRIAFPVNLLLIALVSLSLIPLGHAIRNREVACGINSPALRTYNRRAMVWALAYMGALAIALTARNTWHPAGPVLWLLAVLPSLPIFYFVWSLGRYLAEEQDEYLRMRQIQSGLFATGLLLVVATFWGFLETFGIVPHAEGWWAIAIWAAGLGLGNFIQTLRDRQDRNP